MSHDSPGSSSVAPDRVVARVLTILFAAWLAMTLAAALAVDRVQQRDARATELAQIAAAQSAGVRQIADDLERIARTPEGPDLRAARVALGWELERLLALERRRARLAPDAAAPEGLEATTAAVLRASRGRLAPAQALAAGDLFAARLAPQAERLALRAESEAAQGRGRARMALGGALGLQLAALAALLALVALPARARIEAWVHASRAADQENRFRLLHDPLTQLPNAAFLRAHLTQVAAGAERATRQTAVLRLDLDRFKTLRETLGQRTADEIVRITARRIRNTMRAGDFAAHLGQDDFVLVATDLEDANAVSGIAHRVQAALTKPFSLQGGARRIGCSIGVTMIADDLPEAERALANAEIALAEAQEAGPVSIRYFNESLRVEAERREALFAELLAGLERGEFAPYFQPQIALATGEFSGFEALVRWRHPRRGLLAPVAFLEAAEQADLTERIGEVVLAQSLAALTAWDAEGLQVPKVGINFAMAQLRDPRLIEKIKWEVERNDVEPPRVAIEVLETVLIKSDADLAVRNLRGLASAGFQIELDDFGTGHASIANLRRLMVDRIKIDRSFVFGIETNPEQQTLTASMIAMARALGIRTLAEGVETAEAAAVLRRLGCDNCQGYLVSQPLSQAETFGWLRAFTAPERRADAPAREAARDPNMP